ncbi:MAG: alpha-mannosidase [Armatimonadia bacterium]|nr:alpha-mannosidase [Armatimonadia bacterium]
MLTDPKILPKLKGILERYYRLRFRKVAEVPVEMTETKEHFRYEPGDDADVKWKAVKPGASWGDDGVTAWLRGDVRLPEECDGEKVLVRADTGGETLFIVDGETRGVFDGNHPAVCLTTKGKPGASYHLSFEAYAGHSFPGTQPFGSGPQVTKNSRTFGGIDLVVLRGIVGDFCADLQVLLQLAHALPQDSLRRGRITAALASVFAAVDADPREEDEADWTTGIKAARRIMAPLLKLTNGPTMPYAGLIGASHIDTAWLWPLAETWRKCARTFSSALSLLEQYPDMIWLQPAPCHAEVVRQEYPELFERIKESVAAGRWEPNGGMWVEPDCNMPSGEAFVRQVLVAQRWTREHFGYTGDTLWLPDVFGYSAALPQILRLGRVEFFCTTKIAWNDTTRHPYDTFRWKGIDGTSVITHFNAHHSWPDPESLIGQWNWMQHKDMDDRRLCAYGYGDGGGGPMAEMLEVAKRVKDLEGCPRATHTTLSDFMCGIRDEYQAMPEWSGELYLELHRGTLTSIAGIKKGNRRSEVALREAEFLASLAKLHGGEYPAARLLEAWKKLLVNQFHDILPGSSVAEVNDEAIADFDFVCAEAAAVSGQALAALTSSAGKASVAIANSLSWRRNAAIALRGVDRNLVPEAEDVVHQRVESLEGESLLLVGNLVLPALETVVLPLKRRSGDEDAQSAFKVTKNAVETPFAKVRFNNRGEIASVVDKATGREAIGAGKGNIFLMGQDIPAAWDNWDIDADQALKMSPVGELQEREVVADGPLQLRLRAVYKLTGRSTVTQDIVFHSTSPRIDFETQIDWHEKRKLLKVGFDLDVLADTARHEIQYGHVERPTHCNLPQDRARFEVCAHKWTDLSENGFGVALLNDCKYGVSVHGSWVGLSLIKSGVHPDDRGDEGTHTFTYSLLPHEGGFSVPTVVRPAYELNVPITSALVGEDARSIDAPVLLDSGNVIIESLKWAEEGDAFVVRLYDAGKVGGPVTLEFGVPVKTVTETNILEEDVATVKVSSRAMRPAEMEARERIEHFADKCGLDEVHGSVEVYLRPFEVKTLRCEV